MVEGPAGLLAVGASAPPCNGRTYQWPLAASPDGITWQPVDPSIYGQTVDASAAGFITTGIDDGVLLSATGVSWKVLKRSAKTITGLGFAESGASFVGGFVISGEANSPAYECTQAQAFKSPALWWSLDGQTWTHDQVPNLPASTNSPIRVCHFGDNLLIANLTKDDGTIDGTILAWSSSDGRTWRPLPFSTVLECPDWGPHAEGNSWGNRLLASSDRNLIFSGNAIYSLGGDLTPTPLAETGELPAIGPRVVFGPAGFIVPGDDGNTYVGVPVAG